MAKNMEQWIHMVNDHDFQQRRMVFCNLEKYGHHGKIRFDQAKVVYIYPLVI